MIQTHPGCHCLSTLYLGDNPFRHIYISLNVNLCLNDLANAIEMCVSVENKVCFTWFGWFNVFIFAF